jgi:signal transduction histidine kinase
VLVSSGRRRQAATATAGARAPARRPVPLLPASVAAVDTLLLLFAAGVWLTRRVPAADLAGSYLLGDAAIGTGFAVGGALITLRVRRNAIGWLMLLGGTLYLVATAVGSLLYLRLAAGDGAGTSRALAGVFVSVWMPAVAVLFPLTLQLFPTGRPINRFWTGLLVLTVVCGACTTAAWILSPTALAGLPLHDPGPLARPPSWVAATLHVGSLGGAALAVSLLAPLVRLVRRPGEQRLQVLWLVWAALVVLAVNAPTAALLSAPPPLPLLTIPLLPLAMTAAVLRYQLFGVTVVINRTIVYLALTAILLGGYLAVVYGAGRLVAGSGVRQVLATGLVAVAFSPLRARLQRLVDRVMFGPGADPYGVLADLGRRLQSPMTPDQVLPAIASTVAAALGLPWVQVSAGRPGGDPLRTAEHGTASGTRQQFPLTHRGEPVGTLSVAVPARRHELDGRRRALLTDLAGQAGPAVHAVLLTEELAAAGQRTIAALDAERTRIRRDLHDGLGPALTGVALETEAARTLLATDPDHADRLLAQAREQVQDAVADIRRLVYDLRPPALDGGGLVAALRDYVARLTAHTAGRPSIGLELPADLPRLDPAVEVAAYRIVTEALTNVVRHSTAHRGHARLWLDDGCLHLQVSDDGAPSGRWLPGIGLTSMRERTEQLGGGFAATGTETGGTVTAWLPAAPGAAASVS